MRTRGRVVTIVVEKRLPTEVAEAGVHVHNLERENARTKLDGAHRHLFILPDGSQVWTEEDGAHEHALPESAADEIPESGAHAHRVTLPTGEELTTSEDGAHEHDLQVWSSGFDGIHVHALVLPDGTEISNLWPGEYWQHHGEPAQEAVPPAPPASELAKRSASYLEAVLDTARKYLPDWLWRRVHAGALPSAGGRSRWRADAPSAVEKIALQEIRPPRLRALDDSDLGAVWLRLHQWFAAARRRGEAVESFVSAAAWTRAELERRGRRIGETELSRLAAELGSVQKSAPALRFDALPPEVLLVEEFISVIGSVARGVESPADLDVLFRARRDTAGEHYLVQAENIWLPVRNVLRSSGLPLHYVDNPQGPHGDCVPLYDLVLRRRDAAERRSVGPVLEEPETPVERVRARSFTPLACAEEKRVVYAVAMEPDAIDAHGEFTRREDIERAAHEFMRGDRGINVEHRGPLVDAHIVESWIQRGDAQLGGKPVRDGTWIVGIHIPDENLWQRAKAGDFGGVSVEGWAQRKAGP